MLEQVTEVEIKCCFCGSKLKFTVSDFDDLAYMDDIIQELEWAVLMIGYACPSCKGH